MLEDHITCPVRALVVGEEVTIVGFDREGLREIQPCAVGATVHTGST